MLELPRSVRLAAWGSAVLAGAVDVPTAVRAVTGDDEPHQVQPSDDPGGSTSPLPARAEPARPLPGPGGLGAGGLGAVGLGRGGLGDLLGVLGDLGVERLRVALPAPGDVRGLPGPPGFNEVALEATEAVLTAGGPGSPLGLVPEIEHFGSVFEPGTLVTWRLHAVQPERSAEPDGVREADRELRSALAAATAELARLDVARWRDDAADQVAAIRDGGIDRRLLPATLPQQNLRVVATAARVRAIVALAAQDDGASISGHEVIHRSRTLHELDAVARRAMAAAINAPTATA